MPRCGCSHETVWTPLQGSDGQVEGVIGVATDVTEHKRAERRLRAALEREHALADTATVTLELTETVLMRDAETAASRLRELKGTGVRLAVDDFGTGYSSLGYLDRLPVDVLKIDKSFIDRLGDEDGAALIEAILQMAHTLGLETVAEADDHLIAQQATPAATRARAAR